MYKKIISLFLVIATVCGVLVVPVSATEALPPAGSDSGGSSGSVGLGLDIVDFVDWSLEEATYNLKLIGSIFIDELCPEREGSNFSHSFIVDTVLVDGVLGDYYVCQYCGRNSGYTADAHGLNSAYNQYVSSLQTDLGGTVLANGMIRIPYPSYSGSATQLTSIYRIVDMPSNPLGHYSSVYMQFVYQESDGTIATYYNFSWTGNEKKLSLPYDAYVTGGYMTWGNATVALNSGLELLSNQLIYAGNKFGMCTNGAAAYLNAGVPSKVTFCDFGAMLYVDVLPVSGLSSVTGQDITINSRPTSIVGDYGIIGDDGTIIKVDGNMIVDESTSTVFNPVTNVTNNYTDYAFDYSDRSYNLTLEDGSTLKVVYGDENVTIQEGDTIYNIYYLISDDSGSGDDPGSGDTPSGEDMSWWKQAWTNFTDKLFSILGNGGSSVNPDTAPAVPDDEETGEKGYSVIDLFVVLKDGTWAFITGIVSTAYDGFTGFVESVSSAGSFFTFYDEESEDGILFVPLEGGETIWD